MTLRSSLVALLFAGAALSGCGGSDDASTTPPAPAPSPRPTPSFTAIRAAIGALPVANVYVAIGIRDGTIFRYQKGSFSPTAITPIASRPRCCRA